MANFVAGIISLVLGIVLVANLFMPTVKNTNTDAWTTGEVAMWSVVGLAAIIGIVYGAFNIFGLA
jgi:hypothetical protein